MTNSRREYRASELIFVRNFPAPSSFGEHSLLIYDRRLNKLVPGFAAWVAAFPAQYGVGAGEELKELRAFPGHIEKILTKIAKLSPRRLTIVAAGGGSVGDFSAFVASVLKRGVGLVHVPTTWLAAIDSSHGGKTALNAAGGKNQIGTFYPAAKIYLIESVLKGATEKICREALAELGKIALIDGRSWVRQLMRESILETRPGDLLWKYLDQAIEAKSRVVRKDPFEEEGDRQILNLGHTLGHVIEAECGVSHGEAVALGLFFALEWSLRRGLISPRDHFRSRALLTQSLGLMDKTTLSVRVPKRRVRALLKMDKKVSTPGVLNFIFLRKPGLAQRTLVSIEDLLEEGLRQGRIK